MRIIRRSLEVLAVAAVLALQAAPSQAQTLPSTFIRSDGNDTLNCNDLANRCTSIARGVFTVGPGGNVSLLDSNVHGAFSITKSLSILADGGQNAIVGSAIGSPPSGIHINTASANNIVTIRGVNINQISSGFQGVTFIGSGTLRIENCIIRGSSNGFGINFIPTGPSELHVSNCTIADNGNAATGGGILVQPTGSGSANVVLDNVRIENNRVGVFVNRSATTGAVTATIRNSTISGNVSGVVTNASGAVARLMGTTVSDNTNGLLVFASGQIISNGNNAVDGNTTNGAFTSSIPPQ